jgi:hypothetical protein
MAGKNVYFAHLAAAHLNFSQPEITYGLTLDQIATADLAKLDYNNMGGGVDQQGNPIYSSRVSSSNQRSAQWGPRRPPLFSSRDESSPGHTRTIFSLPTLRKAKVPTGKWAPSLPPIGGPVICSIGARWVWSTIRRYPMTCPRPRRSNLSRAGQGGTRALRIDY